MTRLRLVAAVAVLALVPAGAALGGKHATSTAKPKATLVATVADPFVISLTKGGKKVATLKAGRYTIVVKDSAADHDFHLFGPGLDKTTSVTGTGTTTWKVTLKKGAYTYQCDPHASFMKGSFTVK